MRRHAITVGIVACALLFSHVIFNGQRAVAVQTNTPLGTFVWTVAEDSTVLLPCCQTEEEPVPAKIGDPALVTVNHEQAERVASANVSSGHAAFPTKRDNREPAGEEVEREEFVLKPIHMLLLGSALIGLGMLRNRHRKA